MENVSLQAPSRGITCCSQAKTLLVEDHPIYREGLHMILSFSKIDCEVVAEASNVRQAIDWLETHPEGIDLAILDYFLPDGTAIDVLRKVKKLNPNAKVLVITGEVDRIEVRATVSGLADGFISKDIQSAELINVINAIMRDRQVGHYALENEKGEELTRRETDIIKRYAQGKNTRQIAQELDISVRTVETHKNNIYSKLDINSNAELIKYAILNGLL